MFNVDGQTTVKVLKKPRVFISEVALQKMNAYVTHCNDEIGWLGSVETFEDNTYLLQDVFLFEQEVHATTCEIDEQNIAKWAEEILMTREDGMSIINNMRAWGHSHVNMAVSPSGQDETQFERLASDSGDYFIRIIANKQNKLRLDFYDVTNGVIFNCLQWERELNNAIDEEGIIAEIKKKITKKVYQTIGKTSYKSGYEGYGQINYYDQVKKTTNLANKKVTNNIVTNNIETNIEDDDDCWLYLSSAEELISEMGCTEDDIVMIANTMGVAGAKAYIEKEVAWGIPVTYCDASHVKTLCEDYIRKLYTDGLY